MTFLKKYWWVFALIIGAFLLYWFVFRKDSKPKFVCNNTKQQWEQKMAAKMAAIQSDADWVAKINQQVAEGKYTDLNHGLAVHAEYQLRIVDNECNPALPLNSKDQFNK